MKNLQQKIAEKLKSLAWCEATEDPAEDNAKKKLPPRPNDPPLFLGILVGLILRFLFG